MEESTSPPGPFTARYWRNRTFYAMSGFPTVERAVSFLEHGDEELFHGSVDVLDASGDRVDADYLRDGMLAYALDGLPEPLDDGEY